MSASIDSGAAATGNVASPLNGSYTFHEVVIGQGSMNKDLAVDNVQLILIPNVSAKPAITSFTRVGGGVWEATLEGAPNTKYEFRSSTTLNFTPGTLVALTQGNPGTDAGTVDGSGNFVTTNGSGIATVRMTLSGNPSDFVRAQSLP